MTTWLWAYIIAIVSTGEIDYTKILNRLLPDDIRVMDWGEVDEDFSARYCPLPSFLIWSNILHLIYLYTLLYVQKWLNYLFNVMLWK